MRITIKIWPQYAIVAGCESIERDDRRLLGSRRRGKTDRHVCWGTHTGHDGTVGPGPQKQR